MWPFLGRDIPGRIKCLGQIYTNYRGLNSKLNFARCPGYALHAES